MVFGLKVGAKGGLEERLDLEGHEQLGEAVGLELVGKSGQRRA